ncbi:hypothetical protein AKJ09_04251 [Labilithrix luteola]|uniref:DUF2203 domain-containing protein n=1 Tax=Labilithrix luteola TaxID=1391654 RepID=A0A0K1PVN6_9BACT|nr:DUF2203 domain-containing protein [Labilithrix luteola]AKU97587.1 hypothetical protein AKJ09_04251 [Labilithrix luteola]
MDDTRVFTLEAVNAMVPRLSEIVGKQLERRSAIESLLTQLGRKLGDVPERLVLDPSDPADVRMLKEDLVVRIEEYQASWKQIEAMGAVLKDPRIGLLDFYGTVDGRLVWLCWKYPEREVAFYHGLEEGYAGRKPIGASLKLRLLN